mmetsp:Transcript_5358/g.21218  ORF Transcript_5358/g.21218 Transcript_5358/m.21218 type:complete len:363 (-) Transcript_5358:2112-3200(-)
MAAVDDLNHKNSLQRNREDDSPARVDTQDGRKAQHKYPRARLHETIVIEVRVAVIRGRSAQQSVQQLSRLGIRDAVRPKLPGRSKDGACRAYVLQGLLSIQGVHRALDSPQDISRRVADAHDRLRNQADDAMTKAFDEANGSSALGALDRLAHHAGDPFQKAAREAPCTRAQALQHIRVLPLVLLATRLVLQPIALVHRQVADLIGQHVREQAGRVHHAAHGVLQQAGGASLEALDEGGWLGLLDGIHQPKHWFRHKVLRAVTEGPHQPDRIPEQVQSANKLENVASCLSLVVLRNLFGQEVQRSEEVLHHQWLQANPRSIQAPHHVDQSGRQGRNHLPGRPPETICRRVLVADGHAESISL